MELKIIKVTRGLTKNKGKMWTLHADDGENRVNAFASSYPDRNTVGYFNNSGYDSFIFSMQNGDSLEWYDHPITATVERNGQWLNLTGINSMPDGATHDEIIEVDPELLATSYKTLGVTLAQEIFSADLPVTIWDVETTGVIKPLDDIVSIAICDAKGESLLEGGNLFVRPKPYNRGSLAKASRIHGLTWDDLKEYDEFPSAYPKIKEALEGTIWVVYNQSFDPYMLWANCVRHGLPLIMPAAIFDAMEIGMYYFGSTNKIKLTKVAEDLGVEVKDAHNAFGDVLMTWKVLDAIANSEKDSSNQH